MAFFYKTNLIYATDTKQLIKKKTLTILCVSLSFFLCSAPTRCVHSPIILIATYEVQPYYDGTLVAVCYTSADTFWSASYFVASIVLFFVLPFSVLVLLYAAIACKLLRRTSVFQRPTSPTVATTQTSQLKQHLHQHHHQQHRHQHQQSNANQHRRQVIGMLIAVVSSFFVCLLPFRAFTLWIIVGSPEQIVSLGLDAYYCLLYFCRIMLYLNSALNPILYTCMSSKFRNGFWRLATVCCPTTERRMVCTRRSTARGEMRTTLGITHKSTRVLRRDATLLHNSMSTSSGSGIGGGSGSGSGSGCDSTKNTEHTSLRNGGSLSTSVLNSLSEEQHITHLEATINTTTCIYTCSPPSPSISTIQPPTILQ